MKTHFAKILPILLALSLLIGLVPLAGLMASAEVQAPPEGFTVVNAGGKDHEIDAQNHNDWQPANGDVDLSGAAKNARLGFYFDTTAIAYDASQGDKNNYAFYLDLWVKDGDGWKGIAFSDDKMERVFTRDGKETTVTGHIKGEEQAYFCLPVNATGYIYMSLGDDVDTSSVVAMRLTTLKDQGKNLAGKTVKARNIGYLGKATPDQPDQPEEPDLPRDPEPFYGDNYIVTNNNIQRLHIENGMRNDLTLDLSSNAKAPAGAKAIAFRYDTTRIPDTTSRPERHNHAAYWSLYAGDVPFSGNIDKAEANGFKFLKFRQVYRLDDLFHQDSGQFDWVNTIPLRAVGYVLIDIDQIQDYAQFYLKRNVTVADIGKLVMLQEWGWNEDLYDRDLKISDVGYVMDPEAFIAAYQQSFKNEYEQHPLAPAGDLELKVGAVEGDFAELSWGEADGAKRYLINRYDKDGKFLATETTRRTKLSLQGLDKATAYRLQVLAIGENDAVLAASNVADITTLAQNVAPYMKGLLEYDAEFTATVKESGSSATVEWDWIGGVDSYAVHLYEKNGDTLTFVKREVRSDKTGSMTFDGLEDGKTYIAQVVSYDASGSIIYAYAPTATFAAGGQSTDEPGKTDDGKDGKTDDSPVTGVALPGAVMLLAVLSGGAAAVSRKRRG